MYLYKHVQSHAAMGCSSIQCVYVHAKACMHVKTCSPLAHFSHTKDLLYICKPLHRYQGTCILQQTFVAAYSSMSGEASKLYNLGSGLHFAITLWFITTKKGQYIKAKICGEKERISPSTLC